jgi:hypothetical protein
MPVVILFSPEINFNEGNHCVCAYRIMEYFKTVTFNTNYKQTLWLKFLFKTSFRLPIRPYKINSLILIAKF